MSKPCECLAAGFCERWRRRTTTPEWRICQGLDSTPEFRAGMWAHWRMVLERYGSGAPVAVKPKLPKVVRALLRPSCVHRGEPTGEMRECPSCSGTVSLKVFRCGIHGECTVAKPLAGVACCQTCPDYKPS